MRSPGRGAESRALRAKPSSQPAGFQDAGLDAVAKSRNLRHLRVGISLAPGGGVRSGDLESARARARSIRDPFLRGIVERALLAAARHDLGAVVEILSELEQPAGTDLFGTVPDEGFQPEELQPEVLENPELELRPLDEEEDLGLALVVEGEGKDPFDIFDEHD
jgi:hypothetical protein